METLQKCQTMEELEKKLQLQGIEMQYKYRGQTTEKQRVSFKIGEDVFKGSKVDRQFSLNNLEKALAGQKQILGANLKNIETYAIKSASEGKESKVRSEDMTQELSGTKLTDSLESSLNILRKPGEDYE